MEDFPNKMTSLGEVQRIIGLSLSKIQMGRNQRGGLPLHKNLLVATVLNKARDLYMQETMYMNYKMMTGQFGAAAAAGMTASGSSAGVGVVGGANEDKEDDMEDTPDHEDYEEDSESDAEDDAGPSTSSCAGPSSLASVSVNMNSPCTSSMAAAMMMRAAAANASMNLSNQNDETQSSCSSGNVAMSCAVNSDNNSCLTQMSQQMNMAGMQHMFHQQQSQQVPMSNDMQQQQQQSDGQLHNNCWHNVPSHLQHLQHGMMPFLHSQMQQQQQQMLSLHQQNSHSFQHQQQVAMAAQAAQAAAFAAARAAAVSSNIMNAAAAANNSSNSTSSATSTSGSSSSDEGFIDEPDCDCDARNFSTSDGRVPFQYCYHCAPFHANGRGPTLVPTTPATPQVSSENPGASDSQPKDATNEDTTKADESAATTTSYTMYDMDSKSTKNRSPCAAAAAAAAVVAPQPLRGTKRRRRISSDAAVESSYNSSAPVKRRRHSEGEESFVNSPEQSFQAALNDPGYQPEQQASGEVRIFRSRFLKNTRLAHISIFF